MQAGLLEGDVIKAVDKKPIAKPAELLALLQARKPGDKVAMTVERKKESKPVSFVVPDPAAAARPNPRRPNSGFYSGQRFLDDGLFGATDEKTNNCKN